ncbi:MAG: FAD-binding protein, partial [Gemmatimonadales bacterium]|nr:FAD-binding protein [Gemmatimonadales bacterium]
RRYYLTVIEPDAEMLTHWPAASEQILRRLLQILTGAFVVVGVGYEVGPRFYPDFFLEIPFVTNSVVKIITLAMTAWFASRDMQRQLSLVGPIILVHLVSIVVQSLYLVAGGPALDVSYQLFGQTQTMGEILFGAILLDSVLAVILASLYGAAWRSRIRTKFLSPLEYRTLEAIADIMVGTDKPAVPPGDIARNVDERLVELRTDRRVLFRVVLLLVYYLPVLALRAPLAEMGRSVRSRFLKYFFTRQPNQKPWQVYSILVQMGTRVGHQLTALGYYNDPRAHQEIGYLRFTDRPSTPPVLDRPDKKLQVLRPWDVPGDVVDDSYDVCIIGTGAGGATAAYALAAGGMKVLMIERGQYIESRHFTEDELHQITSLYDRGMLQVAEDFKFSVLQGNCVGGSTTVNNAICFDPPRAKLQAWQQIERRLAIDEIQDATLWLRSFMQVRSLEHVPHHAGADVLRPLTADLRRLGVADPVAFEANIVAWLNKDDPGPNCFGCGNCNIGCGWDRKLSMLDHTLPAGQLPSIRGKLRILAECEAMRLRSVSRGRGGRSVSEVEAVFSDGRRVAVRAKQFVVSAGAINSSHLLLRSGIGGIGSSLPVGSGLSFNMLTPVFAEFEDDKNCFNGIQMGHYLTEKDDRFIIETWFSPPIGLATAIGGWFEDHHTNMKRARNMVAYGMVVGTQNNGVVYRGLTGPSFRYTPARVDLDHMKAGLDTLG